jgi:hypothetical protein
LGQTGQKGKGRFLKIFPLGAGVDSGDSGGIDPFGIMKTLSEGTLNIEFFKNSAYLLKTKSIQKINCHTLWLPILGFADKIGFNTTVIQIPTYVLSPT